VNNIETSGQNLVGETGIASLEGRYGKAAEMGGWNKREKMEKNEGKKAFSHRGNESPKKLRLSTKSRIFDVFRLKGESRRHGTKRALSKRDGKKKRLRK